MKEIVKLINTFIIKYYDGQGHRLWKKNKNCELASSSWFVCSHSVLQHKTYESQGRQPMGSLILVTSSSVKIPDGSQAREEGLRLTPGSGGVVHPDQEGTAVGNTSPSSGSLWQNFLTAQRPKHKADSLYWKRVLLVTLKACPQWPPFPASPYLKITQTVKATPSTAEPRVQRQEPIGTFYIEILANISDTYSAACSRDIFLSQGCQEPWIGSPKDSFLEKGLLVAFQKENWS